MQKTFLRKQVIKNPLPFIIISVAIHGLFFLPQLGQKKFSSPRSELKLKSIEFIEQVNKLSPTATKTEAKSPPKKKRDIPSPEIKSVNKHDASDPYISGLIIAIHNKKNYPKMAKRLKQQGSVQLSFSIKKSGLVSNIEVKKSSGYEQLDKNAVATLKALGTLKPLPERFWPELKINIPIEYKLLSQ